MSEANKQSVLLILGILLLIAGVTTVGLAVKETLNDHSQIGQPAVIIETLDPQLDQFAPLWKAEIGRRFPNAVAILVHGGDFVEGQWVVGAALNPRHITPIQEVVRHYANLYPDRTVVVLACNTGHLKLGIPGVYYAKSSVWCVPDRAVTYEPEAANETLDGESVNRSQVEPDVVGNIFEFVRD